MGVNYTVKYVGHDREKVVTYGNQNLHFSPANNLTVDIKPILTNLYSVNSPEFKYHARVLMSILIKDYECLPSVNIDTAVEEAVNIFNTDRFVVYRDNLYKDIQDLVNARRDKEIELRKDALAEQQKAQDSFNRNSREEMAHVSECKLKIEDLKAQMSKEDDTVKLTKISTAISSLNEDIFSSQGVISRFNADLTVLLSNLKAEQETKLKEALDVYNSSISILQSTIDQKLIKFHDEISKNDEAKIAKINEILRSDFNEKKVVKNEKATT